MTINIVQNKLLYDLVRINCIVSKICSPSEQIPKIKPFSPASHQFTQKARHAIATCLSNDLYMKQVPLLIPFRMWYLYLLSLGVKWKYLCSGTPAGFRIGDVVHLQVKFPLPEFCSLIYCKLPALFREKCAVVFLVHFSCRSRTFDLCTCINNKFRK